MKVLANDGISKSGIEALEEGGYEVITTTVAQEQLVNYINENMDRHIITAEDPVEFNISGINQVNIKEEIGLNFSSCLRSFLRQDPDIMLIGEMRDQETVDIAIKAALTHQVDEPKKGRKSKPATERAESDAADETVGNDEPTASPSWKKYAYIAAAVIIVVNAQRKGYVSIVASIGS